MRQLLAESLVLALLATIPALAIAARLPSWLLSLLAPDMHIEQLSLDMSVVLFTAFTAIASCALFGLAPALHASRPMVMGRRRLPLRSLFLSAQVAFCVVLLVSAALFARTISSNRRQPSGFAPEGVMELRVVIPANDEIAERSTRLAAELEIAAREVGARDFAVSTLWPFRPGGQSYRVAPGAPLQVASEAVVSSNYFSVMGHRMLAGRTFRADTTAKEIVVNRALAESLGGVSSALGRVLHFGRSIGVVVGVVENSNETQVEDRTGSYYRAFAWNDEPRVLVRGGGEAARNLARTIMTKDPSLTVSMRRYDSYLEDQLLGTRFASSLSGALGALALTLATIGIFGVLSYWVQQRQHDISVHMALGAEPAHVVGMVLRASARAIGWGLFIGVLCAAAAAQLLRSALLGLSPLDPLAYAFALSILAVAAVAATMLPVRRAIRIDPMQALRAD